MEVWERKCRLLFILSRGCEDLGTDMWKKLSKLCFWLPVVYYSCYLIFRMSTHNFYLRLLVAVILVNHSTVSVAWWVTNLYSTLTYIDIAYRRVIQITYTSHVESLNWKSDTYSCTTLPSHPSRRVSILTTAKMYRT